eukprot:CAMPEP_0115883792 /NCGR_PEP_ID=MMETSP0287-20121206/29764_1 /TAXON_ID=412157 /ORGANISM="Chrysochromulina rotalis, Strain UIO044" /LENGTH=31 /DNA_ID= /DNA_START= /DNA_END= /DNA_ORIENTATION=
MRRAIAEGGSASGSVQKAWIVHAGEALRAPV